MRNLNPTSGLTALRAGRLYKSDEAAAEVIGSEGAAAKDHHVRERPSHRVPRVCDVSSFIRKRTTIKKRFTECQPFDTGRVARF